MDIVPDNARISKGLDCCDCLKPIPNAKESDSVRKCDDCRKYGKIEKPKTGNQNG